MGYVTDFINEVDSNIPKLKKLPLLYVTLQATPIRWWGSHYNNLREWWEVKTILVVRFGYSEDRPPNVTKYQGNIDPKKHLQDSKARWVREGITENLWVLLSPQETLLGCISEMLGNITNSKKCWRWMNGRNDACSS